MKLDKHSLAVGSKFKCPGGTPNWATALGQSPRLKYRINDFEDLTELLKGLIYKSVSLSRVSTSIGRPARDVNGNDTDSPILMASVFDKVYFNNKLIEEAKFILLVTRDDTETHNGRLRLKYGRSNTYTESGRKYTNNDFFVALRKSEQVAEEACIFISELTIENQDELRFKGAIVNPEGKREYETVEEMKAEWDSIFSKDAPTRPAGENVVLYGVPGCGKSYTIEKQYCRDEQYIERVVFHPDYTYTDFVGQILPSCNDGKVTYDFVPGAFTRILRDAENDPENDYYFIIEELNRGNASAIFGDVFQLLDRNDGISSYGISNEQIAKYVYNTPSKLVKLPRNLYIIATMNTSDQNVFTLDNAFKRRWKMRNVVSDVSQCPFAKERLCDSVITWENFVTTINKLIISASKDSIGNEDKRMGAYFIQKDDLKSVSAFSEKVLMYLWNDAFKYNRELVFKPEYETLEDLLKGFYDNRFKVFIDSVKF